jgi:glycosyltransferase involved in cell wall biosynthesis
MRITVVEPVGKGGMIHYAWQLCSAMTRAGADVTLITDSGYELDRLPHVFALDKRLRLWDSKKAESPAPRAVRTLRRAGRAAKYYREWLRLVAHLRKSRPDVAQFGDLRFAADLLPLQALRRSGIHLADICHNVRPFAVGGSSGGTFRQSPLQRRAYQRIYERFSSVFVHFDRNRREFESTFGLADRTTTIVHGNEEIFSLLRDPGIHAESIRRELSIPAKAQVVLLFGTLSPYKRLDLLIDAFARLRSSMPDAHLLLAGHPVGISPSDIERMGMTAGLGGAFSLVPRYVDSGAVAAWMELASVVVFPYDIVFQSGAVHVPLTFGRPVIATSVGAMQDVIEDGRTGLLVPPDDAVALAAALGRMLSDRGEAEGLGRRAAEVQRTQFSWDRVASVILERYERAIGGRR